MQKNNIPLIHLSHVSKSFGSFEAISDISLDIIEGENIGIVGPNGAGKTTLLHMICALIPVSSGTIEYRGQIVSYSEASEKRARNVLSNVVEFRRIIGFVPQSTTLDNNLTAIENIELQSRLFHKNPRKLKKEIKQSLDLVGLSEFSSRLIQNYSGGMKRRLELARALFHHPHLLILDEPTLGLDPVAKHEVWEYLQQLHKSRQITMVLTTNSMEEAERLCDRIILINNGHIVAQGTPQELKNLLPGNPTLEDIFIYFTRPLHNISFTDISMLKKIMETLGLFHEKEMERS